MKQVIALVVVAAIALQGCSSSIIDNKVDDEPTKLKLNLPEQYHLKGSMYLPYAELEEPIEAWVDLKNQNSRIDYYHGMHKVFQFGFEGEYGTMKELIPMTMSREETNVPSCVQIKGFKGLKIEAQKVIPDDDGFTMVGRELIDGKVCEKWQLKEKKYSQVHTYTLFVRRQHGKTIPVKYQMHGFNGLFDSHYDHYYILYSEFEDKIQDSSVFQTDPEIPCPGHKHSSRHMLYAHNPMKDLIDRDDSHVSSAFENFKTTHNRNYKNENEHEMRKHNFKQNLRFIHSKNRAGLPYTLDINSLADLSLEEMNVRNGRKHSEAPKDPHQFTYTQDEVEALPENWDWRNAGAVNPVKDQATCGSCWAFGAVGSVEGAYFVKYGQRLEFSEQAVVDCGWVTHNSGCDGGADTMGFELMLQAGGLPLEVDYGRYLGADGYCHIWNATKTAVLSGYKTVTPGDIDGLRVALFKNGPVSISIDANPLSMKFYSSGVYYDPTCKNSEFDTNHTVLLVGFGTLNGTPYWVVKNSWSTYWGNNGYIIISRENNNCGVASSASFPTLK